uniref:Uncharacterized protein n=1 Tax=Anopheles coluzzii TaxID=1518534 RepID=A0A8W7P931_ANOCL
MLRDSTLGGEILPADLALIHLAVFDPVTERCLRNGHAVAFAIRVRMEMIHLRHLPGARCVRHALVLAHPYEARKAQRNALLRIDDADAGPVHRAERQIGTQHLPHLHRLEPIVGHDVRLMPVVRFRGRYDVRSEKLRVALQIVVGEAGPDLADRLVLLVLLVVAGEQEAPVRAGPLAPAPVAPDHDQIERIAHPGQVVLLELEPVARPLRYLVRRLAGQRFHHQALAVAAHRLVQEALQLVQIARIEPGRVLPLALDLAEVPVQQLAPLDERSLDQRLPVQFFFDGSYLDPSLPEDAAPPAAPSDSSGCFLTEKKKERAAPLVGLAGASGFFSSDGFFSFVVVGRPVEQLSHAELLQCRLQVVRVARMHPGKLYDRFVHLHLPDQPIELGRGEARLQLPQPGPVRVVRQDDVHRGGPVAVRKGHNACLQLGRRVVREATAGEHGRHEDRRLILPIGEEWLRARKLWLVEERFPRSAEVERIGHDHLRAWVRIVQQDLPDTAPGTFVHPAVDGVAGQIRALLKVNLLDLGLIEVAGKPHKVAAVDQALLQEHPIGKLHHVRLDRLLKHSLIIVVLLVLEPLRRWVAVAARVPPGQLLQYPFSADIARKLLQQAGIVFRPLVFWAAGSARAPPHTHSSRPSGNSNRNGTFRTEANALYGIFRSTRVYTPGALCLPHVRNPNDTTPYWT